MLKPNCLSAFLVDGTGPYPIIDGSTPAKVVAVMRALGFKPSASARSLDITIMPDAPSVICDDEPAVTVPPLGLKTGRKPASASTVVSSRMVSSWATINGTPLSSCPITGIISLSNLPSARALAASLCERSENLSMSSRLMPCIMANISAVMPMLPDALATDKPSSGFTSAPLFISIWPMCSTPPTT